MDQSRAPIATGSKPHQRGTDRSASIAAHEFVWTDSEHANGYQYILPAVARELREFGATNVLDLGCGNGAGTAYLAREKFPIAGCDMSSSGLLHARATHPEIVFFEHEFSNPLPPQHQQQYDAVVAVEVIEHLLLPRQLLSSALQALRPGGLLIMTTPHHGYWKNLALAVTNKFDDHWHPLRDFGHVKFFSKKTILALLTENGFSIRNFRLVGRVPILRCSMVVSATRSL